MADEARHCPNCPYSFPAPIDPEERAGTVSMQWSPLPLFVFLGVVAVVLGVWLVVTGAPERYRDDPRIAVDDAVRGKTAAAPVAAAAATPAFAPPSRPALPAPSAGESESEVVIISAEVVRKAPPPVKEWRLRGFVYDLMTLEPLAGARLEFSELGSNDRYDTVTDARGRYRTVLRPLAEGGYSASISLAGYSATYLDPGTEGVREKSAAERRVLCRELSDVVLRPAALRPHGGDPLVTDFYLAPLAPRVQ
ncbi:MAG: carboxypeptidase-like regulatory domain-containing protein [Elusimicrobia bacterium]|nr:carboxypeptidase-like regulatory domain-containing protein [Elusimicrobiota bacterium]